MAEQDEQSQGEGRATADRRRLGETAAADRAMVRQPPHSPELEQAVLAVLLQGEHAAAMHIVREKLGHPMAFFQRDHRLIYQACLDLDDEGRRVDATAVADRLQGTAFAVAIARLRQQQQLQEADQLDGMDRARWRALYRPRPEDAATGYDDSALAAVGGFAGLGELIGSYATTAGLGANADSIKDLYLKRQLIRRLGNLVETAHRTTDRFQQLVETASSDVLALSRRAENTQVYSVDQVVTETLDAIGERQANPDSGLKTGIRGLDQRLMALRPGGLYVLAARPGVGKTSFALSLVDRVLEDRQGDHVLFFSLEVDRVDLVKKLLTGIAGLDFAKIESGLLSPEETKALVDAAELLRGRKLDVMDVSDLTVAGLRSIVKRHQLEIEDRLRLVVIDYLQLLSATRPGQSEYEKVSDITRTLKIMAKELRIPVIALSQMNRESERAGGAPREPRVSDLRGSGSVEQDADAVIFLHQEGGKDDEQTRNEGRDLKIIVAKNRFGPTGTCSIKFFPDRQRFIELATNEDGEVRQSERAHVRTSAVYDNEPSTSEDLFG